jgi:hypothetical protein
VQQFDGDYTWEGDGLTICIVPTWLYVGTGEGARRRVWVYLHVRSRTVLNVVFKHGWREVSEAGWRRPAVRTFVDVLDDEVYVVQLRWKALLTLYLWRGQTPAVEASESRAL